MMSTLASQMPMSRLMAVVACLLACAGMAGFAACGEPAAPKASISPNTNQWTPPARPFVAQPTPAQPVVALPVPTPPVAAPSVAAAVADLGQKYPGLFTFDSGKDLFRFNADILFDSGSTVVKAEPKRALTELASILNADSVKERTLITIGYTDSDRVVKAATIAHLRKLGKPANNKGLSAARAESVAAVLEAGGIDSSRMSTEGKGQSNPVADNRTAQGKAQNRRVEIYVTPLPALAAGKQP